jgi:hypothetical protein
LHELLRQLFEHALEEVAVPHHVTPEFGRFSEIIAADATIFRLQQFLAGFDATHQEQSGVMLYLVHSVTEQSVISTRPPTKPPTRARSSKRAVGWLDGSSFSILAFSSIAASHSSPRTAASS